MRAVYPHCDLSGRRLRFKLRTRLYKRCPGDIIGAQALWDGTTSTSERDKHIHGVLSFIPAQSSLQFRYVCSGEEPADIYIVI